jgi:hypothetical protein
MARILVVEDEKHISRLIEVTDHGASPVASRLKRLRRSSPETTALVSGCSMRHCDPVRR